MPETGKTRPDGMNKGAIEDEGERQHNGSLAGQLGHRDQDEMLKAADTDFPEPDAEAEISGR